MSGQIILIGLLCLFTESTLICLKICEEGEYCSQDECISCPEGSYQVKPIHQITSCTPWTIKSSESNYVVVRNGTSKSDVLWTCREGYYEYNADICMRISTLSPVNTTTSIANTTFLSLTTTAAVTSNSNGYTTDGGIVKIVVPILIVILVVVIMGTILYRIKCALRIGKNTDVYGPNQDFRLESEFTTPEKQQTSDYVDARKALLPISIKKLPEDINFRFFYLIIKMLTVNEAEKFLRILEDPSGTFLVDNIISFKRAATPNSQIYLPNACLDWASKNHNITNHKELVQKALVFIGRGHVLREIQELEDKNVTTNNPTMSDNFKTLGSNDSRSPQTNERKQTRENRVGLYDYLNENLNISDVMALMFQLPNTDERFNAKNFFDQKIKFERMSVLIALVDTLEEWHVRNPCYALTDCIAKILKGLGRNDILENEEFLKLRTKIES